MTQDILLDLGEEYVVKNGAPTSFEILVYNDSTDNITDTDDLGAITTEPSNSNYARQTVAASVADISGDWGVQSDNLESFDFSDQTTSEEIDTVGFVLNFQAVDTGDGSAQDHLVGTAALTQTRDIGSIDTLEFAAGDIELTLN